MRVFALILALLVVSSLGFAQTVTVTAGGGGTYTTIASAEAHFTPDPDGGTPNVIQITDSSVYDEQLIIDVPVTIQGLQTGVNRPIIAARLSAGVGGSESNDGVTILCAVSNEATSLENLIIIPSLASTPTDDLLRSFTIGTTANYTVNLTDVVLTANNGSDAPVTYDGLAAASMVGATDTGDDGMYLSGGVTYNLTNVVSSHHQNGSGSDGMVCSGAAIYNVGDGCVFSFNNRLGIQANGDFTLNAPTDRVMVIGNLGFAGVWFAGNTANRSWDGINIINTAHATNPAQGWGLEIQNLSGFDFSLTNAIIAGSQAQGIVVGSATTTGTVTLTDVTIAGNLTAIQVDAAAAAGTLNISDSILAGNASPETENQVRNLSTGAYAVNIDHCGLPTAGPQALFLPGTEGPGAITVTNSIANNPAFIETSDFTSASYFDVDHPAYGTAATGGTPLGGGADWIGSLPVELGVLTSD